MIRIFGCQFLSRVRWARRRFSGGNGEVAIPVPIPNTEVKHLSGDGTAPGRVWESSTLPGFFWKPGLLMESGLFFLLLHASSRKRKSNDVFAP